VPDCHFPQYLARRLESQPAADILVAAIAPTSEEIGKLAAIAAIRTTLSFFLAREMRGARRSTYRATR
jgi:uncharacterized membrane protein